ncbi:hypothetical protein QZQ97_20030 [Serratia sp. root2]|uniref:hypothetical protein n=1 Tax=Serratia TaxID=613 RepID=UPI00020E943F|nr:MULTISPECIES: hypothetical protein [Serratia]AEF43232.1 hypothetical protein SerAS9_0069 [Serratia plymuthica AS9]AEF48184.1 hypothetical protein SerAS12_0069 [Serratia sp. AS12]AEG25892.1 hypothetical protein SerAS13_0069 [Serratia sp. AS13]MDT3253212.1 hypothetical protein [Serratia sp. root2]UTN96806.1 hypothetical protein NLX81_00345 [Serratia plymuthica]
MKKFNFIYNNEKYFLYDERKRNENELEKLMGKGFQKVEVEAESKKEAVKKFKEKLGENSKSLEEYTKDISFSSIIEVFLR